MKRGLYKLIILLELHLSKLLTIKIPIAPSTTSFWTYLFHVSSIYCSISATSCYYTIRMICFYIALDNFVPAKNVWLLMIIFNWRNIGWRTGGVQWGVRWLPMQQWFLAYNINVVVAPCIPSILITNGYSFISCRAKVTIGRWVRWWTCMIWGAMTPLLKLGKKIKVSLWLICYCIKNWNIYDIKYYSRIPFSCK